MSGLTVNFLKKKTHTHNKRKTRNAKKKKHSKRNKRTKRKTSSLWHAPVIKLVLDADAAAEEADGRELHVPILTRQ